MFVVLRAVSDTRELYTRRLHSTNVCIGFQVMFKIEEDVEGIRESVRIGLCAFVLVEHVLWHMHRHICVNVCTENM